MAHIIIDGGIIGERLRTNFPTELEEKDEAGLLSLEGIADAFWFLHRQPAATWSQEIDLRPSVESF